MAILRISGKMSTTPEARREFASTLRRDDHLVLDATGNTYAIGQVLKQHADRIVVSNPIQTRDPARRGPQIAAVAAARKILVLTWHLLIEDKDSAFLRPSLFARKYRTLELALGRPAQFGNKRSIAHEYNLETVRQREIDLCLQAERAYAERRRH